MITETGNLALLCEWLDAEGQEAVRTRLDAVRLGQLSHGLGALSGAAPDSLQPSGRKVVERFAAELSRWSVTDAATFERLARHWVPGDVLHQILYGQNIEREDRELLAATLDGISLAEHLRETDPRLPTAPFSLTTVAESCARHRTRGSSSPGRSGSATTFSAGPTRRRPSARRAAAPRRFRRRWHCSGHLPRPADSVSQGGRDIPLIEGGRPLGICFDETEKDRPDLPPLTDTLRDAYTLIFEVWPEVVPWARMLVPAFVDAGTTAPGIRRSGTRGAVSPIFLSRVPEPLMHAEDVVHELQHIRFHLLVDPALIFSSYADADPSYVSPVRTDPRPLWGLHLALHAFVAVNELRLRLRHAGAVPAEQVSAQLFKSHCDNLMTFQTILDFDDLAPAGRVYFAEVARALSRQHDLIEPGVPAEYRQRVDDRLERHCQRVLRANSRAKNASSRYRQWPEIVTRATSAPLRPGNLEHVMRIGNRAYRDTWIPNYYPARYLNEHRVRISRTGRTQILAPHEDEQLDEVFMDSGLYARLERTGHIVTQSNAQRVLDDLRDWHRLTFGGPYLHIVVLTRRCNLNCTYCHMNPVAVDRRSRTSTYNRP